MFECTQSVGELRPFPVEPGQPIFQSRNLSIDVVSAGDWSPLSAVGSSGWRILACIEPKGFVERGLANFQPDRGLSHGQSFRDHAAGAGRFHGVDGRLATALAASRCGGSKPRASAFAYQVALELPQRAEQEYRVATLASFRNHFRSDGPPLDGGGRSCASDPLPTSTALT
jgi:hypothetical protein